MRILVTGGCGFLGSNLAAHYISRGDSVTIIDALFRCGSESNLKWLQAQDLEERLVFHKLDLADHFAVDSVFTARGPFDFICHVGGQVAMTSSLSDPRRDLLTNVIGTFNVLEATRKHSPEALVVYSSTNKVYGDLTHLRYIESDSRFHLPDFPAGLNEALPLDFSTPYGCSKGAADQYTRDWSRVFGIKTVVFRHSSIYGGRQFPSIEQGWIAWFCKQALQQAKAFKQGNALPSFTISGTGKQVRDVLHAHDLVALYDAAYQHRSVASGEIFNIGGGIANSLSLIELLTLLASLTGLNALEFSRLPRRQSDQDYFVADIEKARRLLHWSPNVSSQSGIQSMLEWAATTL